MLDLAKYAGPIYSWCLRRTANVFDAQDLAQEILLEIFRSFSSSNVRNQDAWVWRIARNRYARHIAERRQWISIDDIEPVAAPEDDDTYVHDAAFRALHSISALHREVLVDHYVFGIGCDKIAEKRGLVPATVRSRLYYGRDMLKRRWNQNMYTDRVYDKLDWYVSGNGDIDISYLESQISRAIVRTCYTKWCDVEDISDATGIPCMYIEDELRRLEYGDIIKRNGNRFISNIVVHSQTYLIAAERVLKKSARKVADAFNISVASYIDRICNIDFYRSDKTIEINGWWLLPLVMRAACAEARKNIGFERGDFMPRNDGGKGWIFADEIECGVRKYYSGCNRYYLEKSRFRYFWTGKYLSDELVALLKRLENEREPFADAALTAECVRCGMAIVEDGQIMWNIPIFTAKQYDDICALAAEMAQPIVQILSQVAEELLQLAYEDTPRHLHEKIRGIFGADLNAIIAIICDVMEEDGGLTKPGTGIFAGQVIMIR